MKLVLIGFMGVGKTTIGKKLSEKLNYRFIDTDYEIEKLEGKTIAQIFEYYGEIYFRNLENKILKNALQENNIIISTGGGIVTNNENYKLLKNEKNVFFLDASVETIVSHLYNETNKRPLLKDNKNLSEQIKNLLSNRYEMYKEVSDILIEVNNKNIDEVISQILVYIG